MSTGTHAVVIGGSIAGLCAGRVLSDHFDRVTVLDRDHLPDEGEHRKGVPQSRHPHALLDAGRRDLDRLFPGFERLALERGALELNPGLDMATMRQTGWSRRRNSPFTLLFASRVLIEGVIRDLASGIAGLEILQETEVTGLLVTAGEPRVTGVKLRTRPGEESELEADLVVDASGRATRVPEWLEKIGLPPVETTVVDANAGYSSRWYQGPSSEDRPADWWWKCLWVEPIVSDTARPEEQFFGLLFPVEHDRWVITTASWGGQTLARDPESFEAMISRLRTPVLADAISKAEPISPVYARRSMQNTWRHYEKWSARLPGFIATGDAVCGFNPVYGQGMSSASRCAAVLQKHLASADPHAPDFPASFFAAQAKFLRTPWMMAVSRDRTQARMEGDDGGAASRLSLLFRRLAAFWMGQTALAAQGNEEVNKALFSVGNLSAEPSSLFRPAVVARVALTRARQLMRPTRVDESDVPDYPAAEIID
jgi:2-polyprenyl-6-methoxyphenol hydroxylase-like FAD-dependent oxidoreductase